jgi:hypothetical protein
MNSGTAGQIVCWKCGAELAGIPMPLSRLSVCLQCEAELYVCLMCEFHDPKLRLGCREERAEHVKDKDRANFCEFFQPRPDAHRPKDTSGYQTARARLDALFHGGQVETPADKAREELEKLFGSKAKS